jgi:quinol monooxygenase YgiN
VIAQVFTLAGPGSGPGEVGQKAIAETKAADGCEEFFLLIDRAKGEGLAVVLWRDEAAMNAIAARREELKRDVQEETPELQVSEPRIYEVVST